MTVYICQALKNQVSHVEATRLASMGVSQIRRVEWLVYKQDNQDERENSNSEVWLNAIPLAASCQPLAVETLGGN